MTRAELLPEEEEDDEDDDEWPWLRVKPEAAMELITGDEKFVFIDIRYLRPPSSITITMMTNCSPPLTTIAKFTDLLAMADYPLLQ